MVFNEIDWFVFEEMCMFNMFFSSLDSVDDEIVKWNSIYEVMFNYVE